MWLLSQGLTVEAQTYNLMIATCVKMGQPDSAMAIYQRSAMHCDSDYIYASALSYYSACSSLHLAQ